MGGRWGWEEEKGCKKGEWEEEVVGEEEVEGRGGGRRGGGRRGGGRRDNTLLYM